MNQIETFSKNQDLLRDIKLLIENARNRVAVSVNSETTLLYWNIGDRINGEVLNNQRADYGKQIVATVSRQLQDEFGEKGFDEKNIRRMMKFSQLFPDVNMVSTSAAKLSWSHFVELLPLNDDLQREFYLTMASFEGWSVRMLRDKIEGMLYERTLISGKPDEMIKSELSKVRVEQTISADLVFKNPYFLEFTGLKGVYSERSLEESLVVQLEQFILELGNGFSFIERQKRMIIDGLDFRLDLLFYHRKLRRLIAVDLKIGKFKASYKGQMELYLRWLEKNEMQSGEETPIGLILCTEGNSEQIELLQLDNAGIKVAQYLTELPSKELLQKQLKKSLEKIKRNYDNFIEEN